MYVGTSFLFMIVLYSVFGNGIKWEFLDPNVADHSSVSKGVIIPVFKKFVKYKNFYLTLRRVTTYNGAGLTCKNIEVFHLQAQG